MARIELTHVTKRWGGFYAVDDLDLLIEDNAFVTLLGPFTREVFVLSMNVEGMRLLLYSTQFATQIFVIHP